MGTHFCGNIFTAFNFTYAVTSKQLYRLLHYTVQSAARPTNGLSTNGLPESTTCSTSNYTHCSQLLLIHRMVAYSNHSPVENKMATRAMLIRDAFMLPMELLTVIPYKEQGKEDWLSTSLIKIIMSSCGLSMCPLYWWVTKQCEINENVRSTTTYISIIWTHHTPQYRPYQLHRAPHSASCMHAGMSLTSHILTHDVAVTDRPSGGATNIVVGKGCVNDCNEGVFCCSVHTIKIDNTGIGSVTCAGTGNSTPQFISGVGTTPSRARARMKCGQAAKEDAIVPAILVLYR